MSQKKTKIIYWIFTGLFLLAMLFSGIGGLIGGESANALMAKLGYPPYLITVLSVAKLLGVLAVATNKFPILKEWAYAGFTFDFLGASISFLATGDKASAISPLVILAVMFVSYVYWKKLD